jgi:NAD(P)-dependent dehydrogenase (short-subunit alcohol dehydrogenase family)
LDIVILNAGVAGSGFVRNARTGHCEVVQVNYLGTVLLAVLLLPVLRDRTGQRAGRLTIVGSGGVFQAKVPNRGARPFLGSFDDLKVQPWDATERYYASKVLGMFFFVRLLEYLPPAEELMVNMVDPGFCKGTELHRDAKGLMGMVLSIVKALTGRSMEDGAWTYVDAAVVKGKESHGCFVMDWKIYP